MRFQPLVEENKIWSAVWLGRAAWQFTQHQYYPKNSVVFTFYKVVDLDAVFITIGLDKLTWSFDIHFKRWNDFFHGGNFQIIETPRQRLLLNPNLIKLEEILRQTYPGIEFVWDK